MKIRNFYLAAAALFVFFFVAVSLIMPVQVYAKVLIYEDESKGLSDITVDLTLTEYKPGVYTVTGTLSLQNGRVVCPIKGIYYERGKEKGINNDQLSATAFHPELRYDLIVDGQKGVDGMGRKVMNVVIKDPKSDIYYYSRPVTLIKTSNDEVAKPEVKEDAVPTIEGKEPSPPEAREEWNGRWRGREKSTHVIESNPPVVREGEFEAQTIREGSNIRLIEGGKQMVFTLTKSNPNVATFREQKKQTIPMGWGETIEKRTIFLRDGKLYMATSIEATSYTTLPGFPQTVGHSTSMTYGRADRVK